MAGPQASGRNGRLRLCGRCSFGHGPSGSSYSVYTALFVFVCLFVCLFVFAGMPFISVDRPDGSSFLWHQPCQRCNYTTSVDTQKTRYKKLFTHVESHASAMSLLESGEYRYIKAINHNNNNNITVQVDWAKNSKTGRKKTQQVIYLLPFIFSDRPDITELVDRA